MQKATYLALTLRTPGPVDPAQLESLIRSKLTGIHDGLDTRVLRVSTSNADPTAHEVVVYVEGEQPGAEDFEALATAVLQKQWNSPAPGGGPALGLGGAGGPVPQLEHTEHWDDFDNQPRIGGTTSTALAAAGTGLPGCRAPVTSGQPTESAALPSGTDRPAPVTQDYHTPDGDVCPGVGSGPDSEQNQLKNRIDTSPNWQLTTCGAIIALPIPDGLPRRRDEWSADQHAAIAEYEGLPLQVVGFLAGAQMEGPERCNCNNHVDPDYHIWLVDAQGTDRSESIVVEATPRVRALHKWDINRMCNLVQNGTQVRISGWLMMDPDHPDQVGNTRGTTWEIHPIIQIEALDASTNAFVALDDATLPGEGNGGGGGGGGTGAGG